LNANRVWLIKKHTETQQTQHIQIHILC